MSSQSLINTIITQSQRLYTTFDSDASRRLVLMVDWTKCHPPNEVFRSSFYPPNPISVDLFDRVIRAVATAGDIETLDKIHKTIAPIGPDVWVGAAAGGQFAVFDWAVDAGILPHDYTGVAAAYNGRRDVLEWFHGCDYDWRSEKRTIKDDHMQICTAAALGGHLEFVKWAQSDGYLYDGFTSVAAAANGHLDILKWAHSAGLPIEWESEAVARNNYPEICEWLAEIGCEIWNDIQWEALTPLDYLQNMLIDV